MAEESPTSSNKKFIFTALVVLALLALAYLQFRTWRKFDWTTFFAQIRAVRVPRVIAAVAIIFGGYVLRAMRWSVMLRPTKDVPWSRLLAAQFIGFTGLAILGRPGEFIRPYFIARQEGLSVSSQMGVWLVERIFDMSCYILLVAFDLVIASHELRKLPHFSQFKDAGIALFGIIAAIAVFAFFIWRNGDGIAAWSERRLAPLSKTVAASFADKVRTFGHGLHTIRDLGSFFTLLFLSIGLWLSIAYSYLQITRAFHGPLQHMEIAHVILLLGFSIAGSAVQLPVVGGGAQLATITALVYVFEVPNELAVSCGILLWLVTFVSPTPVGLSLSRHAHLSLTRLSKEATPAGTPPHAA
jgi:uncharacterized protein (TIRG00374 family)